MVTTLEMLMNCFISNKAQHDNILSIVIL